MGSEANWSLTMRFVKLSVSLAAILFATVVLAWIPFSVLSSGAHPTLIGAAFLSVCGMLAGVGLLGVAIRAYVLVRMLSKQA